jgi:hypothetical protein
MLSAGGNRSSTSAEVEAAWELTGEKTRVHLLPTYEMNVTVI